MALEDRTAKCVYELVDFAAGVSIGAMLCKPEEAARLLRFWHKLSKRLGVGKSCMAE